MLEGSCLCGRVRWRFDAVPDGATACNCTLCRRYGALWAYDYENERIRIAGPTTTYTRAGSTDPSLEIHFCPTCGGVLAWRGLRLDAGEEEPGGDRPGFEGAGSGTQQLRQPAPANLDGENAPPRPQGGAGERSRDRALPHSALAGYHDQALRGERQQCGHGAS